MKKQAIMIRGGESFATQEDFFQYLRTVPVNLGEGKKNWRDWIIWALSETYDVMVPAMPCKQSAHYEAWKIWFERHFEFIHDDRPIVVGNSLGATFLLKYLSENGFPKKISQLHLVAPMVTDDPPVYMERLASFEFDLKKLSVLADVCEQIHVWHSRDDMVVPYANTEILGQHIPTAIIHSLEDRGHFGQPAFMELLQCITAPQ